MKGHSSDRRYFPLTFRTAPFGSVWFRDSLKVVVTSNVELKVSYARGWLSMLGEDRVGTERSLRFFSCQGSGGEQFCPGKCDYRTKSIKKTKLGGFPHPSSASTETRRGTISEKGGGAFC